MATMYLKVQPQTHTVIQVILKLSKGSIVLFKSDLLLQCVHVYCILNDGQFKSKNICARKCLDLWKTPAVHQ